MPSTTSPAKLISRHGVLAAWLATTAPPRLQRLRHSSSQPRLHAFNVSATARHHLASTRSTFPPRHAPPARRTTALLRHSARHDLASTLFDSASHRDLHPNGASPRLYGAFPRQTTDGSHYPGRQTTSFDDVRRQVRSPTGPPHRASPRSPLPCERDSPLPELACPRCPTLRPAPCRARAEA
jgi:hypothetical protein